MNKRVLVKDVYAELLVLSERVNNLKEDVKQNKMDIADLKNYVMNELKHAAFSRNQKLAIGGAVGVPLLNLVIEIIKYLGGL